jgi:hypothetical protein
MVLTKGREKKGSRLHRQYSGGGGRRTVRGQFGLHSETLSQKQQQQKRPHRLWEKLGVFPTEEE